MIRKLRRLLKIKEMKEEEALRALRNARRRLSDAEAALEQARNIFAEAERVFPEREDRIYDAVMGRIVDQTAVDDVKADVVRLATELQELSDEVTRMLHVVQRMQSEVDKAASEHARCVRVREKYVYILDRAVRLKAEEDDAREEGEIEELFAKPVRRVEDAASHGA